MKPRILKNKFLQKVLYLGIILLLIITGIQFSISYLLRTNGISVGNFNYDFPSSLTIEDITVDDSSIHGEIENISIDWSWRKLLSGNIKGEYLFIKKANIVHFSDDQLNNDTTSFRLPEIQFENINIQESNIEIESNTDSTHLFIPSLKITGFDYSENLSIDTIINYQSEISFRSSGRTDLSNDPKSDFNFNSLPEVSINYLEFTNCLFNYKYEHDQEHEIRDFNFQALRLSSKKIFDSSIEELSFIYQDTLAIDVALGDSQTDENDDILLTNLAVNLPGLELIIPKLEINNRDSFSMDIIANQSMIHSSYLWLFFSRDYFPLTRDIPIYIDGGVSYRNSELSFDQFTLKLSDKADLQGNARFGFDGASSNFATKQLIINSTLHDLSSLFGFQIPVDQNNIDIHSVINIEGTYDHFVADCQNILNGTNIHLHSELDTRKINSNEITASLKSDHINPSDLISSLPEDVKFNGLEMVVSSAFNEKNIPVQFNAAIKSDSILIKDFWVLNPEIELSSDHSNSLLTVRSSTYDTEIHLETTGDIFEFEHLDYKGLISIKVPSLSDPTLTTGQFYSNIHGSHQIYSSFFNLDIELDSIIYSPINTEAFYTSTGEIHFKNEDGVMNLKAHLDSLNSLECAFTSEIFAWFQDDYKMQNFPEASIDLRLKVDSTLMNYLSYEPVYLDLPMLSIKTNGNVARGDLRVRNLIIDDYQVEGLKADFSSVSQQLNGNLNISSIQIAYLDLDSIRTIINTDQDSTVSVFLSSYLPAVKNNFAIGTTIRYMDDGILLNLNEKQDLQFGDQTWKVKDNRGLFIDKDLGTKYVFLQISNEEQNITINSSSEQINFIVDSILLEPLAQLFIDSTAIKGTINFETNWSPQKKDLSWMGSINHIVMDTLEIGFFKTNGTIVEDRLSAKASLESEISTLNLTVLKEDIPIEFDLTMADFDLGILNDMVFANQDSVLLGGTINASLRGSYNETLQTNGILSFHNALLNFPKYGFYAKIDSDTVFFDHNNIELRNLEFNDINQNKLSVNGNIELSPNPTINLGIKSDQFALLDQANESEDVWGKMNFFTNLNIQGELFTQLNIDGQFNTLSNSNLNFKYKSSVSLDEREKVITFRSFDKRQERPLMTKTSSALPIHWNVDMDIGQTDLFVLIYESSRDYARLTADGNLRLRSGTDGQLQLFGEVASNDGSIFYDAPMVSDLNLKIESAAAEWNGDPDKPLISFRGSEVFRVSLSEFPGQSKGGNNRVPVSVHAIIDESSIETFQMHFDLSSSNGQIGNYLESLHSETREKYAINLLVFGSIEPNSGAGGNSLMQSVVSKLNEISRRNIKKADLSFYVDSEMSDENSTETVNKLGYSFSKGLFNKKVRFSVGGDINLNDNAPQGSKKFNPLGNLRLDYVLSENPDITINAMRSDVYKGAIEGQVNESSLGISYQKRFRNFFQIFRKKEDK